MNTKVMLSHGSGGVASQELVKKIFMPHFTNKALQKLDDFSLLQLDGKRLSVSTDSFVVKPLFFPGGDIGKLAVCGTVNDISMGGAVPLFLTAGFILEEGFPLDKLESIAISMAEWGKKAGIDIIACDTKVVPKGNADGVYINTSGVGVIRNGINLSGGNAKSGDAVIISGGIGEHGAAVLAAREGFTISGELVSDCAPLNGLIGAILDADDSVRVLRDPTRGGLATTLHEIAFQSNAGIEIYEENIPVKEGVKGISELMGIDPFYFACEGRVAVIADYLKAEQIVSEMRKNIYGADSVIIGRVTDLKSSVILKTKIGGSRFVEPLTGEILPRIC